MCLCDRVILQHEGEGVLVDYQGYQYGLDVAPQIQNSLQFSVGYTTPVNEHFPTSISPKTRPCQVENAESVYLMTDLGENFPTTQLGDVKSAVVLEKSRLKIFSHRGVIYTVGYGSSY